MTTSLTAVVKIVKQRQVVEEMLRWCYIFSIAKDHVVLSNIDYKSLRNESSMMKPTMHVKAINPASEASISNMRII